MNWNTEVLRDLALAAELMRKIEHTLGESRDYKPELTEYSEMLLYRARVISGHVARWKLWSEERSK